MNRSRSPILEELPRTRATRIRKPPRIESEHMILALSETIDLLGRCRELGKLPGSAPAPGTRAFGSAHQADGEVGAAAHLQVLGRTCSSGKVRDREHLPPSLRRRGAG